MILRSVRAALAAMALVSAATVTAQAQNSPFAVYGGLALPMGDIADANMIEGKMGFQVGAQFTMPLRNALGLRFNADWSRWGVEDAGDATLTNLGAMANLVYNIETGTGLKPYVFGGVGFSNFKIEDSGVSLDDSGLSFNVGVGYTFGQRLFTEVRYSNTNVEIFGQDLKVTSLPIVIGFRF